jgi:hypothetical protein
MYKLLFWCVILWNIRTKYNLIIICVDYVILDVSYTYQTFGTVLAVYYGVAAETQKLKLI